MKKPGIKIEMVELASLKPAPYNPRSVTPKQLAAICRSIREFGVVDPLVVRREDNLIIGGHQRALALKKMVDEDGYDIPGGKVPVVFVDGLDDSRTKLLNLALNKAQGDWEYDALASMLAALSAEMPSEELTASGFDQSEIDDLLALVKSQDELASEFSEEVPTFSVNPRLIFEFSSKKLRDAVKSVVDKASAKDEPAGNTLARLLKVS